MKYSYNFGLILLLLCSTSCSTDEADKEETNNPALRDAYFPPVGSDEWESVSLTELNWNEEQLQPLLGYLESQDTKAFLVLKNGRML